MIALYTKAIATALLLFWSCAILGVIYLKEGEFKAFWLHFMVCTFALSIIAIWVTI